MKMLMNWLIYQIKSYLYQMLFKKKYPLPMLESSIDEAKISLIMPDEIRRQELLDKYKEQWNQPDEMDAEFRIAEKEKDAERINTKLLGHLDSLLVNTSLLALTNEQLAELIKQCDAFCVELDAEAKRRA